MLRIPRRRRPAAIGLWTLLGAWSAANLTDGHIPEHMVEEMSGTRQMVSDLCDVAGMWERTEDGFLHSNWEEYQPMRSDVEHKRQEAKERMAELRAARKAKARPGSPEVRANTERTSGEVRSTPTRPDPTRPDHSSNDESGAPLRGAETAADLVAEWIDHCGSRPPGAVVGQVAKLIGQMLGADAISYAEVRNGLAAWQGRGLHPSALPSVVHELRTPRAAPIARRQRERDDALADARAEAAALDAAMAPRKEIA